MHLCQRHLVKNQYLLTATMLSNCTKSTIWFLFLPELLPTTLQTHNPGHSIWFSEVHRLCPQLQQLFLLDYVETTKRSRTGAWIKGTKTTAHRLQFPWTAEGPLTSVPISRRTAIPATSKACKRMWAALPPAQITSILLIFIPLSAELYTFLF